MSFESTIQQPPRNYMPDSGGASRLPQANLTEGTTTGPSPKANLNPSLVRIVLRAARLLRSRASRLAGRSHNKTSGLPMRQPRVPGALQEQAAEARAAPAFPCQADTRVFPGSRSPPAPHRSKQLRHARSERKAPRPCRKLHTLQARHGAEKRPRQAARVDWQTASRETPPKRLSKQPLLSCALGWNGHAKKPVLCTLVELSTACEAQTAVEVAEACRLERCMWRAEASQLLARTLWTLA